MGKLKKVKGDKPKYKVFQGMSKSSAELPFKDLPENIPEDESITFGLEIWVGNMRTGRGFIECRKSKNRIYSITSFSDKDATGVYLEGSSAFSSVRSGNITQMVMSGNRLNSPFYLSHLPKLLQYKNGGTQRHIF